MQRNTYTKRKEHGSSKSSNAPSSPRSYDGRSKFSLPTYELPAIWPREPEGRRFFLSPSPSYIPMQCLIETIV